MEVLRTAILDCCRRKKGEPFYPSEIVRRMFPEDWELFLTDLHAELDAMQQENLIEITHLATQCSAMDKPELQVGVSVAANQNDQLLVVENKKS